MWISASDIPASGDFWLTGARVPVALAVRALPDVDGLAACDLKISGDRVAAIEPAGEAKRGGATIDLDGGMVWPCFVDLHTHIDKGHIWPRKANANGTFEGALEAVGEDRAANWSAEDVAARMDFSLRCAYAHGTKFLRTHLDSVDGQADISWPVFDEMRRRWRGRIDLQAAALFGIDRAVDADFMREIGDILGRYDGILGAVTYMIPELDPGLDAIFRLAVDKGFNLDFHADETADADARSLAVIAEKVLAHGFQGSVAVGHCCSLSRQADDEARRTLDLVAEAGLTIISLPMCNMYLQGREAGCTPRWRGVTLLHEMRARDIPVVVASDNTRDPFYAYGDLDMVEVYREATRIAQLDHPVSDWPTAVSATPANAAGRHDLGRIAPGSSADLVLFGARTWTEFMARPQSDRIVLRQGRPIETVLPDYRELDDILNRREG